MKAKILGMLAVGLLAGPMAANAAYVYSFVDGYSSNGWTFSFTVTSLLVSDTTITQFDLAPGGGIDSVEILAPLTSPEVNLIAGSNAFSFAPWASPFSGPGTYAGFDPTITMTIRQTGVVPEPGTLALLGLGLAGLGLSRRRRA